MECDWEGGREGKEEEEEGEKAEIRCKNERREREGEKERVGPGGRLKERRRGEQRKGRRKKKKRNVRHTWVQSNETQLLALLSLVKGHAPWALSPIALFPCCPHTLLLLSQLIKGEGRGQGEGDQLAGGRKKTGGHRGAASFLFVHSSFLKGTHSSADAGTSPCGHASFASKGDSCWRLDPGPLLRLHWRCNLHQSLSLWVYNSRSFYSCSCCCYSRSSVYQTLHSFTISITFSKRSRSCLRCRSSSSAIKGVLRLRSGVCRDMVSMTWRVSAGFWWTIIWEMWEA